MSKKNLLAMAVFAATVLAPLVTLAAFEAPDTEYPSSFITDTAPMFAWSAVDGAVSYEFTLGDDTDTFSYFDQAGIVTNSFSIAGADFDQAKAYHWKVRAQAADGTLSDWSDIDSFVIYDPTIVPSTLAPVGDITSNTPLFRWSTVTSATTYDLWILSQDETQTINLMGGINTPSFQEPTNAPFIEYTVYHYKVRSHTSDGRTSIWSNPGSFMAYSPADLTTLLTPTIRSSIQNTLFKWTPTGVAVAYELQLQSEDEATTYLDVNDIPVNGYNLDPNVPVLTNVVYHWHVRSILASGALTPWSASSSFVLYDQGSVPDPLLPFGYVRGARYIEWTQAFNPGLTGYEVQVTDPATQTMIAFGTVPATTTRFDLRANKTVKLKHDHVYEWIVRADYADGTKSLWTLPRDFQITTAAWNGQISGLSQTITQKPSLEIELKWTPLTLSLPAIRYHVVLRGLDAQNNVLTRWSGDASPDEPGGLTIPASLPMATGRFEWLVEAFDVDNNQIGQSKAKHFDLVVKPAKK